MRLIFGVVPGVPVNICRLDLHKYFVSYSYKQILFQDSMIFLVLQSLHFSWYAVLEPFPP